MLPRELGRQTSELFYSRVLRENFAKLLWSLAEERRGFEPPDNFFGRRVASQTDPTEDLSREAPRRANG